MVDSRKNKTIRIIGKIYIIILLVIFGGIVLHAPISVGFGVLFPDYALLIKSWKEILMLMAGVIALMIMYQTKRFDILRNPLMVAVAVYAALHLVLLAVMPTDLASSLAGLAIDLRYVLYFGLVYIAMKLYPDCRNNFIRVGVVGALIVLVFALLQVFVLPYDVLKYIGYSRDTIASYLTVDQNYDFIRINSTLRGPNPLGAYAGMVLVLLVAALSRHKIKKEKWPLILVAILSGGGVVALWASYSRSALVGTLVAIVIVLVITSALRKIIINKLTISIGIVVLLIGGVLAVNNTGFVSNILLHENPGGGSAVSSNDDHVSSLVDGLNRAVKQPLGGGVGSTGSASLFGDSPMIIENQYLLIAHESGWLGLGLFMYIYVVIMNNLWKMRKQWLAVGVFASGISLAVIGLLLPVWVDDTVSIIWWGLAAIASSRA